MAWTTPRTWTPGEIPSASIMNAHIRDNFGELMPNAAEPWKEIRSAGGGGSSLFLNGWVDYDLSGTWGPCRFRKVGFWVQVVGLANGLAFTSTIVCNLPAGYRPAQAVWRGTATDTGGGGDGTGNNEQVPSCSVQANGNMTIGGANILPCTWGSLFTTFIWEA